LLNKKSYKLSFVDIAVFFLIIAGIWLFFSKLNDTFDYQWQWRSILKYIAFIDPYTGDLKANILLKGFITTIKISFWATMLAFFLGTLSGIMGAKGSREQRLLSWVYVETIRNIPSLVLVIIFYYFVSSQFLDLLNLDVLIRGSSGSVKALVSFFFTTDKYINAFVSAVIALAIYEGAYVSEIIRGGIISIPKGMWEAGLSLGLSRFRTFKEIIFPLTLRKVAFPLAGQFISTIKDSAIVSVISIQELTFQGMELMSATYLTFEVWITVTLLYFFLTFPLSRTVSFFEKKYAINR